MTTELIKIDPKEYGLEVEQVSTIEQAFLPKIQEREALVAIYDQLIVSELTPELCKQAKEVRLRLVKVRTGISDIHKTQKAFFLAAGRFVDAWKNKETLPVEQMEEKLSEIENYYVNIEKARIEKLQIERLEMVSKYTDFPAQNLGSMEEEVFNSYLTGCKVAYEAKIEAERLEAERIENERLSEIARQKAIEEENARLKAEAEAKEKQMQEERVKAEAERKAIEAAAQKEREEAEAKLKAEQEKARIEAEKAAKEAKRIQDEKDAENAKLQDELKAKADKEATELKAKQEAEKQAKIEAEKAAKAPFKEKANKWVDSFSLPEFTDSNTTTDDIKIKFASFVKWAKSEINKL